jgi:hypothetical protein
LRRPGLWRPANPASWDQESARRVASRAAMVQDPSGSCRKARSISESCGDMKTIRGKVFTGQRIVLDGKVFIDCQFKDTTLVLEGSGLFEMQNCKIEEDCRLAVEGPGQILLHSLKMMLYSGGWMSRVADNVLHAVRQPPKAMQKKKTALAR